MEMLKRTSGFCDLSDYYKEFGMDISLLQDDSPEALKQDIIKKDLGYMKVLGKNFDLVTIRAKGTTQRGSS